MVVMLFFPSEGYSAIMEFILGLLDNDHKRSHLGLSYLKDAAPFRMPIRGETSKSLINLYKCLPQNMRMIDY
jgi:hypothetical protein